MSFFNREQGRLKSKAKLKIGKYFFVISFLLIKLKFYFFI